MTRKWRQYLCLLLVAAFPENIYWSGMVDGPSCFCSNFLGWTMKGNKWDLGISDFLSFLRNCDLWKHVTRSYSHNKQWSLDRVVCFPNKNELDVLDVIFLKNFGGELIHLNSWLIHVFLRQLSCLVGKFHLLKQLFCGHQCWLMSAYGQACTLVAIMSLY